MLSQLVLLTPQLASAQKCENCSAYSLGPIFVATVMPHLRTPPPPHTHALQPALHEVHTPPWSLFSLSACFRAQIPLSVCGMAEDGRGRAQARRNDNNVEQGERGNTHPAYTLAYYLDFQGQSLSLLTCLTGARSPVLMAIRQRLQLRAPALRC